MVYTKLDVMNYVLDMLQDKFYDMKVHEADWHDLDDCRHAIHVIAQQAETLERKRQRAKRNVMKSGSAFFTQLSLMPMNGIPPLTFTP